MNALASEPTSDPTASLSVLDARQMPPATAVGTWKGRWTIVFVFAVAMAWVEAAVVYYLRTMINRIDPYQANPLPNFGGLVFAELVREFATLVMLTTVGCLAGRTARGRFGYALLAFGVWDIFYYVFLRCLAPWPNSLLDWDILFLLPLPWWGPVLAPVLIASLMIAWGTWNAREETSLRRASGFLWSNVSLLMLGLSLSLYSFMEEAIRSVLLGKPHFENLLPASFNWPLFLVGFACLTLPMIRRGRCFHNGRRAVA